MKHLTAMSAAAAALALATAASAQSLGDIARKEEARRKTVAGSKKVYTNDHLRGADAATPPVAPPPAQAEASPSGAQAKGDEKPADPSSASEPKKDEAYWRGRINEARTGLERARAFQEALQSQINGLSTDFLARDDPAQRAVIGNNRQKALAELERVKKEVVEYQKQIADIEEEARKARVPPGWLR